MQTQISALSNACLAGTASALPLGRIVADSWDYPVANASDTAFAEMSIQPGRTVENLNTAVLRLPEGGLLARRPGSLSGKLVLPPGTEHCSATGTRRPSEFSMRVPP
jgi:hypothetical protein